jgi:Transposase DDE domain group 1
MVGMLWGSLRQSVFGCLAGYEDVNGAERLRHDPEMCRIVGGKAPHASAASPGEMGRFENKWLATEKNFSALANLSGRWIDAVHDRPPPRGVVPAMDSSVSQTHGGIGVQRLERSLCLHLPSSAIPGQSVR